MAEKIMKTKGTYVLLNKEDIFSGETEEIWCRSEKPEDYADYTAAIPECRQDSDPCEEYKDCPEEIVWCPKSGVDESTWVPFFMAMRFVLTRAQEHRGIPTEEAMENSSTDYAEQYISEVFYESGFDCFDTIKRLTTVDIPEKIVERWTLSDIASFITGLVMFGKKFTSMRAKLLPHKTTKDLVELYYTWKRSKAIKGKAVSRARRCREELLELSNLINGPRASPGMLTRRRLAVLGNSGTNRTTGTEASASVKRKRKSPKQTRPIIMKSEMLTEE